MALINSKSLTPHKNKLYYIFALVVCGKGTFWSQLHQNKKCLSLFTVNDACTSMLMSTTCQWQGNVKEVVFDRHGWCICLEAELVKDLFKSMSSWQVVETKCPVVVVTLLAAGWCGGVQIPIVSGAEGCATAHFSMARSTWWGFAASGYVGDSLWEGF